MRVCLFAYFMIITDDHKVRVQSNGEKLPGPRELQLKMFLPRSCDNDDHCRNFHVNQFGQWTAHDITLMPTDYSGKITMKL